jgi:hypothetical protein
MALASKLLLIIGAMLIPITASSDPRDANDEIVEFLDKHIGLSDDEFERLATGEHVTKILDTGRNDEVAVFGAIWIDAPVAFFLAQHEDIERFEAGDNIEAIGKLSDPPQLEDFAELTLPDDDIRDISKCRLGKCEVKMSEYAIERFQNEVDWGAPDAHAQANALTRELMLEHVQYYLRDGNVGLGEYRDKKEPMALHREFEGLLENSPYLPEYIPELHAHLLDFPHAELDGATEFLYWSRVKFGLKPLVRLSHTVLYPLDNGEAAVASKMLYSSHYFRAALELRFLVQDRVRPDADGFYLISINRARADGLTGIIGAMLRGTIKRRTEKGLAGFLVDSKERVERNYRTNR